MEVGEKTEYFPFYGSGHIVGTHRMGGPNDSGTAVTDSSLRSYDHPNLFIMGTGSFPTIGTANPTLTLVALVLRSMDTIKGALGSVAARSR